jgi:hypothetical protein
VRGIEKER